MRLVGFTTEMVTEIRSGRPRIAVPEEHLAKLGIL